MDELTPKKEFLLWDLDKIIYELNYPGLDELIKSISNEAAWVLQKAPLASQIIT